MKINIRLLFVLGCIGAIILFIGDMLFYGAWGSSNFSVFENMKNEDSRRLFWGTLTAPFGVFFYIFGLFGLWKSSYLRAPRLSTIMVVLFLFQTMLGELQHSLFGPVGLVIQRHGDKSPALNDMLQLIEATVLPMTILFYGAYLIWIFLTVRKMNGFPIWVIIFCPALTIFAGMLMSNIPAPLGLAIAGGWSNIINFIWFGVVAITYNERLQPTVVFATAGLTEEQTAANR
jgi:hypothetical protein